MEIFIHEAFRYFVCSVSPRFNAASLLLENDTLSPSSVKKPL